MRLVQIVKKWPLRIQRSQVPAGITFSGEVTPLPGCPDIAVSHAVYCHSGAGSGGGKQANRLRCEQIKALGYSAVMCTVVSTNEAQLRILRDLGWQEVAIPVSNKRTGSSILVFIKQL